jgi:hypothetical protein
MKQSTELPSFGMKMLGCRKQTGEKNLNVISVINMCLSV